ncbi:MAG: DNA polymerase III subunit gamma/tau, partial [Armatimonadota bacterium]|nr:DNA polymerase III subunit gamma/tau [Armatimonadota bacterium]
GQQRITRTLQNALRAGRVTHAYLFTGHRGTGKTTLARILAKALNCERGPTPEPDNTCAACVAITHGTSLDVIEIDGASHTQVDHIRDLKERIVLAPAEGRYKVYIIDEVHMLSTSAFNALLKTLEEPPPHAVFVLVTTEPHRVPPTVASRCQRFDFRRVPLREIEERLRRIAREEGFRIDEAALRAIARLADGSVRDAESILDQVSAYREEGITAEDVLAILGAPAEETLQALAGAVLRGDVVEALRVASALLDEGRDPRQVMRMLLEHFRDLLVAQVAEDPASALDTTPERLAGLRAQAEGADQGTVLRALRVLSDAMVETRTNPQPRLLLEVALIRAARPEMEAAAPGAGILPAGPSGVATRQGPTRPTATRPAPSPPPRRRPAPPGPASAPPVEPGPTGGSSAPPGPASAPRASPNAAEPSTASDGRLPTLDEVRARWARVLEEVKRARMLCHALLIDGVPVAVEGNTLVVGLRPGYNFHVDSLHRPDNREIVERALLQVFGRPLRLRCRVQEEAELAAAVAAPEPAATGDPLVSHAVELFGGEVVEVKRVDETG